LRLEGSVTLGTRTEVKNLNSFRNVEKALHYEIDRQREVLLDGGAIVQETRLWDPDRSRTFAMRGKEEAHDYRYLPDPDLLPLVIDSKWVASIKATLPELPRAKQIRFVKELQLAKEDAERLVARKAVAEYYEAALNYCQNARLVSNWVLVDLLGLLNARNQSIEASPISAQQLGTLVQMIDGGKISGKIAKMVFSEMAATGEEPEAIVKAKGLEQLNDAGAIEAEVQKVLDAHPDQVDQYRSGKTKVLGFFVGQVMRATKGKANPQTVNEVLVKQLKSAN
jgi:aspartyl-tRNA(Asn)/glutamyl-tRNA(Gln) amidotransferase subunit B